MNRKKILSLALCLILILSISACGGKDNDQSGSPSPFEKHEMAYPDGIDPTASGASSYGSSGDHFDSPYYKPLDFFNVKPTEALSAIPGFKTYQQTTEYSCGACSALMVLEHYGVTDYTEMQIVDMAKVSTETGVGVDGLMGFFKEIGWTVKTNRDSKEPLDPYVEPDSPANFTTFVRSNLDAGTPILIDWLDWAGHWQVIIGYDTMGTPDLFGDDVIIVADPYDTSDHYQDGYFTIPAERFFYMWKEGIYTGPEAEEQPWIIATPPAK